MKKFGSFVFYFIIVYLILFSSLFIKQSIKIKNELYKDYIFEENEKYETFITESKEKLNEYKILAKTEEENNCLNEVGKMIQLSYDEQHSNLSTRDFNKYYYEQDSYFYNVYNVSSTCKLEEFDEQRNKEIIKFALSNVPLIEENLMEKKSMYIIKFEFKDLILSDLAEVQFHHILKTTGQTIADRVINNEINLIGSVLKIVGDKYEY